MYQTSEMQKGPGLLHQEYDSQNIPCMILCQSKQGLTRLEFAQVLLFELSQINK